MTEVKGSIMNKENTNNNHLSVPEKKKSSKNNTVSHTDDRAGKLKLYSIGSVILLIAIIVLANILFDGIFGKALTFDFSVSEQNTISQVSVDYINSLPSDTHIRIVGLFERPGNVAGSPYQYIIPLLDDYVKKSDGRITVEYVDMTEHPTIINQLDPTNSYDLTDKAESFVVEYNGKIKIIDPIDCYSYDENMYAYYGNYYITGNNTEFTFTNSMFNLTNDYSYKAYIVTGLKESGNTSITKILESMSIDVVELSASENFTIPEDCNLLILNGPNNDITEKMYVAMTDYLKKGGKMFVAVDYSLENLSVRYDRLNSLLNQMNINVDPVLISENDPGYQLGGYSVDSTVVADDLFADFAGIQYFHSTYARSVRQIESPNSGIETHPVLLTSNKASILEVDEQGNAIDNGSELTGQYNVAMYSANTSGVPSEIFVFGTLNFSSDEYITAYGLNDANIDFFRSCIRELSDNKPFNALNVPTKNIDDFSLDASKATTSTSTVMLIVFMIIIPVVMIAMAVIVYAKRKNL